MGKVNPGDVAPDFELPAAGGERFRLFDLRGRWVVLAFYPADFTTVCTKQFCSYRDEDEELQRLDAVVLGISPQSVATHERFAGEYGLTVPLLADTDKLAARAYGALGFGGFVRRSIFIVDPEGVLRYEHVAPLGLRYKSVSDIARELETLRQAA